MSSAPLDSGNCNAEWLAARIGRAVRIPVVVYAEESAASLDAAASQLGTRIGP